jgi:hypothetical protein
MTDRFARRVEDSAPIIKRGALSYSIRRINKKLLAKPEDYSEWYNAKIIRDEFVKLRNQL